MVAVNNTLVNRLSLFLLAGAVFFAIVLAPRPVAACAGNEIELSIAVNGTTCIPKKQSNKEDITTNPIFIFLLGILKFLLAGAGVAAVGGVAYGGIYYATARGNSAQILKAVKIITNSVVAIVLFFLLFAIFNYLIPGGIFK